MECDKLKAFRALNIDTGETGMAYPQTAVNEIIDEMKQKLHDAEMAKDDAEAANTEYRADIAALKAENERLDDLAHAHNLELLQKENIISELKADNERLNKELNEWIQSAANRPVVIGKLRDELRATRRALWLARAYGAESEARWWYHSTGYCVKYDGGHTIKGALNGKGLLRLPEEWMRKWLTVERKCRAKAEKDKEIAELQKQVHDYAQGLYVIQSSAEKEVEEVKDVIFGMEVKNGNEKYMFE